MSHLSQVSYFTFAFLIIFSSHLLRELCDLAVRAFVSFVRFYYKHECQLIFRPKCEIIRFHFQHSYYKLILILVLLWSTVFIIIMHCVSCSSARSTQTSWWYICSVTATQDARAQALWHLLIHTSCSDTQWCALQEYSSSTKTNSQQRWIELAWESIYI